MRQMSKQFYELAKKNRLRGKSKIQITCLPWLVIRERIFDEMAYRYSVTVYQVLLFFQLTGGSATKEYFYENGDGRPTEAEFVFCRC